jgi:hypothetical protein
VNRAPPVFLLFLQEIISGEPLFRRRNPRFSGYPLTEKTAK